MSRLALVEDLLSRSLEQLRADLTGFVETGCNLDHDAAGQIVPRPGSCDPDCMEEIEERLGLVREIEAAIGRFAEHPQPQWLDDLVDGRWSLT